MGVLDKFLDIMRLNDDDYEFDNDEYEFDEDERRRKVVFPREENAKRQRKKKSRGAQRISR